MALKLANNAVSKLASSITAAATTIAITPGDGAKFPALGAGDWHPATLVKSDGTIEIVRVTARAVDSLTVTRAQEGTVGVAFNAGDRIELRLTNAAIQELRDNINTALTTMLPLAGGTMTGRLKFVYGSNDEIELARPDNTASFFMRPWSNNTNAGVEFIDAGYANIVASIDNGGNIWAKGNASMFSDERVKTNWRDLPDDFVEQLAQVKHGTYDRTDMEATQVGVSAQSLRAVLEHAVTEDADGNLSVVYGNAALVAVIKLAARVLELERKLAEVRA